MRLAKLWLKSGDGATDGQKRSDAPVDDLKRPIADEGVVDEGNVGPPHEEDNTLEVKLHTPSKGRGAVGHDGMKSGNILVA